MDEIFAQMRQAREEYVPCDMRFITPTPTSADVKATLMRYTRWLDRRGFFREDLQCDFEHQIDTFLEDFNVDN